MFLNWTTRHLLAHPQPDQILEAYNIIMFKKTSWFLIKYINLVSRSLTQNFKLKERKILSDIFFCFATNLVASVELVGHSVWSMAGCVGCLQCWYGMTPRRRRTRSGCWSSRLLSQSWESECAMTGQSAQWQVRMCSDRSECAVTGQNAQWQVRMCSDRSECAVTGQSPAVCQVQGLKISHPCWN